ncbi:MAG: phage holin family protein [Akkermansiaceae bacterium]|nr:phage holin family protein [Akkermansiaceae bacterium]
MGFGQKNSSSDDSSSGLKEELGAFVDKASAHTRVRAELFMIEAKEAAEVYGRRFYFSVIGAVSFTIGYSLFLVGMIGLLGFFLDGSSFSLKNWAGVTLGVALLHLIIGAVLIKKSKKFSKDRPIFEYTRDELKKDQQWTRQKKKP